MTTIGPAPNELMSTFFGLHSHLRAFSHQLFQAATAGDPSIVDSIGGAMSSGERFFIAFEAMPDQDGLISQASIISIAAGGQLSHHLAFKLDPPHSAFEVGHG